MKKPAVIIAVRHGEQYKTDDPFADTDLTNRGQEQVYETGERLRDILDEMGITRTLFVSSKLRRAVKTANILRKQILIAGQIQSYEDLRERELGSLDPRQMHTNPAFKGSKRSALYWKPEGGGESLAELCIGRLGSCVRRSIDDIGLQAADNDKTALLFAAHGGINHALLHYLGGMADGQLTHGPLVVGSPLQPFRDPGHITHAQAHIYTPIVDHNYYDVRTIGSLNVVDDGIRQFDSGPIDVIRRDYGLRGGY